MARADLGAAVVIPVGTQQIEADLRVPARAPGLMSRNNCTILDADASRRASLLVAYIHPVCALLAPRRAGASTPRMAHLFLDGS
jgi:hypothetical protein